MNLQQDHLLLQNLLDLRKQVVDIDGSPFRMYEHVWVKRTPSTTTYDEYIVVQTESTLVGLNDLHSPICLDPRTVLRTSPHATFKAPRDIQTGRLVWMKSASVPFAYVCGRLLVRLDRLWFQPLDFNKIFDEGRWVSKHDRASTGFACTAIPSDCRASTSPVYLSQIENGLHWTLDVKREVVTVVSTVGDGPIEFLGAFDDFLVSPLAKKLLECAAVVAYY